MNEEPQRDDVEVRIDATFRNGSVAAAIPMMVGIMLQNKAFADLLSTRSLFARS
jgi:hypothetical protein